MTARAGFSAESRPKTISVAEIPAKSETTETEPVSRRSNIALTSSYTHARLPRYLTCCPETTETSNHRHHRDLQVC